MKSRLLDYFLFQDKKSLMNSNLAFFIANYLCCGYSLSKAFENASDEIDNFSQKKSLKIAGQLLESGTDILEVLNFSKIKLNIKDKYILASSIPDKYKGKIIKNWSEPKIHNSNLVNYFIIFLTTLVFCYTSFSFIFLVFPYLKETASYTKISLLLYDTNLYLILICILFCFVIFLIVCFHCFFNVRSKQEESDLLALISSVEQEDQISIMEEVVNKFCFPVNYRNFLKIIECMKNGNDFDKVNISPFLAWYLQLSFLNKDRTVLKEGSSILNEEILLSTISSIKVLEVLIIIIQGLCFLFISYALFGSLNNLLAGYTSL